MNTHAPDLLLRNARIYTMAARRWADTLTVHNGRISFVGDEAELPPIWRVASQTLDAGGRLITPGFIDSHLHLLWYGSQLLRQVDLVGVTSTDELLGCLSAKAASTSGWIQGHGFDQDRLPGKRFPTREDLDRVSRDRPIVISRICGHAAVANSAALALLTRDELAAGDATSGRFNETSSNAFYTRIPPLNETEQDEAALLAARVAIAAGITCCQTMLDTPDQMAAYARLRRRNALPLRIVGHPPYRSIAALHQHGIDTTFGDEFVRFGAAKIFSDGSLGARTAWLTEPYADDPSTRGIRIHEPQKLKEMCRDAQAKGFQLAIHAIGDCAVAETVDGIEFALAGESNAQHRHRIEHVSVCSPRELDRIAKVGIVAAVQPQFIKSDTWTSARLGEKRAAWAYPFASLLKAGVTLAFGSDCPVEKLDVFAAMNAATRREGINVERSISIHGALHAYTLGSAYAGHGESYLGSLEAGKCADFVMISDSFIDSGAPLDRCKILATYVAGRSVYRDASTVSAHNEQRT